MTDRPRLVRIVSGGQTGVDRAALDAAMAFGLACGGWVPRGRRAEDGAVPPRYPMRETRGYTYAERTRRNVRDSDGTLILTRGRPTGGTALTAALARRSGKPLLLVDMECAAAFRDRRLARPARHSRTQRRRPEGKHLSRHPRPGTGLSVGSVECARECVSHDQLAGGGGGACERERRLTLATFAVTPLHALVRQYEFAIIPRPSARVGGAYPRRPVHGAQRTRAAATFVELQGGETPHD